MLDSLIGRLAGALLGFALLGAGAARASYHP
jgi:hypothetical protein